MKRFFNKVTGKEHRRNKKRARQVQVIQRRNEQTQVLYVTLQTEEEVPDVASPQELNECAPDQHNWRPIDNAVNVESNGTQISQPKPKGEFIFRSFEMQCTTGHTYEVKGYRHHKISTTSQKIRQYSKWTRDMTVNYSLEKEDSATFAIVQCKHCASQLEFAAAQIGEYLNCIISNPDIAKMISSDETGATSIVRRSESGQLATRCQKHQFNLATCSTIDARYIEATSTQIIKGDSLDSYSLVWLQAPTTKVTTDVKAQLKLFKCDICHVYATPRLSTEQLRDLSALIPGGSTLFKMITM